MNKDYLRKFLIEANKAGYASGNKKKLIKQSDRSTTIIFNHGSWKFHDNYFGGEPYGGREVVFYQKKPVWIMVYYGSIVNTIKPELVYPFLQKALCLTPKKYPYRGPAEFTEGDFIYKNTWVGGIDDFSGEEIIFKGSKKIYEARYIGGLVDQRT